jgi:predicted ATPase/DNA-binding winged helix-turn-helix (wHTH) protein
MESLEEVSSSGFRFGRVEVRATERRLLIGGVAAPLGGRAFDLLMALIARRDRVVEKDELLDLVWPGLVVEENNLQVQVNALRKLLGAQAIATVPGRGYRFTAMAEPRKAEAPPTASFGNELPRLLTCFIGRESELESLTRLLRTSRLLSLTGMGGAGKTRLAIELGRRMAPHYADGVRFVDLATVDSPDRVALEVARGAGVVEDLNRPVQDTLVRQLASSSMLLFLDNCEHVLEACVALVERLLAESHRLQVVITSREALSVAGEQIFPVGSLSLPPLDADVEAAEASEAVQLFVNRARLNLPGFSLDSQDVAAVSEICRRLDGIPLAIELAAARLRVLSIEQIRSKLDDRFRLLTTGSRAVGRHQTLQATLQWSYEHLTLDEQSLLQRVSVFAGGWTLEAATAVAGQGGSELELIDRLERLFDRSLVTVNRDSGASIRYGMLETVRQYAHERLRESGEATAVHDAHLTYFWQFAGQAQAEVRTDFVATLGRVDVELANLLAAHAWCDRPHVPPEYGLELASTLRRYWIERDQYALGKQVFERALGRVGAERPTMQRAEALFSLGQHLLLAGRHADALATLLEALALSQAQNDKALSVWCLSKLSAAHLRLGHGQEAHCCVEEGVRAARALGLRCELSAAVDAYGTVCRFEDRFDDAAVAYEEARALCSPGDLGNQHAFTRSLAYVAIAQGCSDRARSLLIESVMLARQYDPHLRNHRDLEIAADLASVQGDWERAARLRGAVDAAADRLGVARDAWGDPFGRTLREGPRRALGDRAYDASWKAGYSLALGAAFDEALSWLSETDC